MLEFRALQPNAQTSTLLRNQLRMPEAQVESFSLHALGPRAQQRHKEALAFHAEFRRLDTVP